MSTSKHIDKICCMVVALAIVLGMLFMNAEAFGIETKPQTLGYENRLFDTSKVHAVDIVMDDWNSFIETCSNEEYALCSVVIDGEAFRNVAIRAKGNTSLTQVRSLDSDRYSFKIEFDHYDDTNLYYGLDKVCLNNIIQDNTYMKDYLAYQMMNEFGVASPLCSYVNITVNGEEWGLYLAVEAVEESFLQRNYKSGYGELYKPDSISMGGGRGNGKDFDMDEFEGITGENAEGEMPNGGTFPGGEMPDGAFPGMGGNGEQNSTIPEGGGNMQLPGGMGMGGEDVSLIYSDDHYSSYSNIFNSAKTNITDQDKDRLIAALKSMNEQTNLDACVDIEDVIRYFVVHNFVLNFDSYTGLMIHNYYLYEHDGQLSMIPWDYNLAFGGFQSQSDATSLVNYPIDSPVSGGTVDSRPMIAWIFGSEEYTEMYHTLMAELMADYFDSGHFSEMIDSVKAMISPFVESDPTKFCTYEEFEKGIDTLKEFCLLRAESIGGQLDGRIGSTSEAQTDKTNFVNADHLTVSDMGSMGNMGGGSRPDGMGSNRGERPSMPENGAESESTDAVAASYWVSLPSTSTETDGSENSNSQTPPNMGEMPDGMQGDFPGEPPDGIQGGFPGGSAQESESNNTQDGMQRPDNVQGGMNESVPGTVSANKEWVLLIISVLVLGAGLVFAFFFKRRG